MSMLMAGSIAIRSATPADAAALLRIYAPYVTQMAVSFECELPTEAAFAARIANTLQHYPYLVAECDGVPVGYAYAAPFKGRAAYDWSAELSVYVDRNLRRAGIGRALYDALEAQLRAMGVVNLYACIATADQEDERITFDSIRFHEHMGFALAGRFPQVACKFGRWYDMVYLHKAIASHRPNPAPPAFGSTGST